MSWNVPRPQLPKGSTQAVPRAPSAKIELRIPLQFHMGSLHPVKPYGLSLELLLLVVTIVGILTLPAIPYAGDPSLAGRGGELGHAGRAKCCQVEGRELRSSRTVLRGES